MNKTDIHVCRIRKVKNIFEFEVQLEVLVRRYLYSAMYTYFSTLELVEIMNLLHSKFLTCIRNLSSHKCR